MFTLGPALRGGDTPFTFRIVASTGSGFSPHYDIFAVGQTIWWGGSFDLNFRPAVISTPLVTGVIPGPSNFAVANAAIGSNSFSYVYDGTHLWGVSSSLSTIRKFNPNTLAQSEFSKSNNGYVIVGPTGDVWVKRSSTVFGKLDKTAPAGADLVTRTFSSASVSAVLTGGTSDFLAVAVSGGIVRRIGVLGTEASVTLPGAGAYTPTVVWDSYRNRLFAIVEAMKTAWDIDLESMSIINTRTWTGLATADRARHVYDPVSGHLWMARFFNTGRHMDVAALNPFDGSLVYDKRVSSGVLGGTVLGGNNELREIMIGPGRSLYAVSPYSTGSSLALVGAVKLPAAGSLPAIPRTIAQINFETEPPVDLVASNRNASGNDPYQLSTISPITGSTYSGWMRDARDGLSSCSFQTETSAIDGPSVGFEADKVLGLDGVTFEMFIRVASGAGYWNAFFQAAVVDADGNSVDFYFQTGSALFSAAYLDAYYYDTEGLYTPNDSDTGFQSFTFPRDQWVHVALVMDALEFRCYVAGNLVRSASATSGPPSGLANMSFQYFWMGTNFPSPAPSVYMDSARARSGAIYSGSSFTPPTAQFPFP
jgi:hypothetical protein